MKTLNILLLAAAGLAMTGCSEGFLDTESKTESTTDNFYKTEADANRALIGCYDGLRQTNSNPSYGFYMIAEAMGAECFGGTGNTDGRGYQVTDRFDKSQSPADLNLYVNEWKNYYALIFRCNEFINHAEDIAWKDETKKATYLGEARTLRAIAYFDLVRLFGNIPLLTASTSENVPQNAPAEVYAQIFEDLKFAAANIPGDAYPKSDAANNDGRVTKYAAEAFMARAYLYYTGYYGSEPSGCSRAEALAACEDIIASNEFALVSEFKNLWPAASGGVAEVGDAEALLGSYAGDGNCETLFAIKFTSTQDYNGNNDSNRWQVMVGMRSITSAPYGKGWGAVTVNPEFLKAFGTGDTRKKASVIDIEGEGVSSAASFEAGFKDWREYTGYAIKKYSPLCFADGTSATKMDGSGGFQEQNHQDYVLMRYADVLLMAAELGSSNAQNYFDQVRKRAYTNDGVLSANYKQVTVSQANIMAERKLEFAFEGINYFDLLRQGVDYAAQQIAISSYHVLSGGNDDYITINADNIIATQGLCQIPNDQITLSNGVLKQNAGW
jgi:hypothetical protein